MVCGPDVSPAWCTQLGVALGLPHDRVYRHPFPGPGVRILDEVKREFADPLREADPIFIEERRNTPFQLPPVVGIEAGKAPINWYEATSQGFALFLPVNSVGVMGDGHTYEYVVALRAVQTLDFMTAQRAHLACARDKSSDFWTRSAGGALALPV